MDAWVTEGVWLVTGDGAQYLPWSLVIIVCVLWTIVTALLFYQAGAQHERVPIRTGMDGKSGN